MTYSYLLVFFILCAAENDIIESHSIENGSLAIVPGKESLHLTFTNPDGSKTFDSCTIQNEILNSLKHWKSKHPTLPVTELRFKNFHIPKKNKKLISNIIDKVLEHNKSIGSKGNKFYLLLEDCTTDGNFKLNAEYFQEERFKTGSDEKGVYFHSEMSHVFQSKDDRKERTAG